MATQKWASHFCTIRVVSLPPWIRFSGPPILLGLYRGFAATLPTGLFHVTLMRASISGRVVGGRSVASGLVMGQLVIILSVYFPHFYVILVKPHVVTLLVLPCLSLYRYRSISFRWGMGIGTRAAEPRAVATAIGRRADVALASGDTKVWVRRSTVLNIIILPLFYHLIVQTPVLARLVKLFVFRHSNQFLSVVSSLRGWLGGSILLEYSAKSLAAVSHYVLVHNPVLAAAKLVKLFISSLIEQLFVSVVSSFLSTELGGLILRAYLRPYLVTPRAVPYIYLVADSGLSKPPVKPVVDTSILHRIFPSIIVIASRLLYLGRVPVPVPFQETCHESLSDESEELSWLDARPASVFDDQQSVRPFRDVKDCYDSTSPLKNELSQYYFHTGVGPGKHILSLSSPPSLSIPDENLEKFVNLSLLDIPPTTRDDPPFKACIGTAGGRKESDLNNELTNRMEALNKGYYLVKVVDSNNGLYDHEKSVLARMNDPFTSNKLRGRIVGFRSTWLFTGGSDRRIADNSFRHLPHTSARKIRNTDHHRKNSLLSVDTTRRNSYSSLVTKVLRIHDTIILLPRRILKHKPRWISKPINDLLSFVGSANTEEEEEEEDIRSVKAKNNVDYAVNDRTGIVQVTKRPVLQPDYRRNLVIGSMRARRRKTLVWESQQLRTHSPLFLRMIDNSAPPQFAPGFHAKAILTHRSAGEDNRAKPFLPHVAKLPTANRVATAKRWDFTTVHWIRGCSSIAQSHSRREIILPILITFKNTCHPTTFQTNERKEDRNESNKEVRAGCNHDGTAGILEKGSPHQWYREGFQTKIANPFHPKHRHLSVSAGRQSAPPDDDGMGINPTGTTRNGMSKYVSSYEASSYGNNSSSSAGGEMEFGHSTVLGYPTKSPFGYRIKRPSFWKPLLTELGRRWGGNILLWIREIHSDNLPSRLAGEDPNSYGSRHLRGLDTSIDKYKSNRVPAVTRPAGGRGTNHPVVRLDGKMNDLSSKLTPEKDCPLAISDQSEYRAHMSTKELDCFVARGNERVSRRKGSLAGKGILFGLIGKDRGYPAGGSGTVLTPINRIVVRVRRICLRLIQKRRTYFVNMTFSGFHGTSAFTRRSPLVRRFNILRLMTRFTRCVSEVRAAIRHIGRSQYRSGTGGKNPLRVRDLLNGRERRGDTEYSSRRGARVLISQAYVLHGAWRLGAVNKYPMDPENWRGNPSTRESTARVVSGRQGGILGKRPRAWAGGRFEWSQYLRRYNVLSEIWCRIAPRGWKMEVEYLRRIEDPDVNDSREKEQSMTIDGAAISRRRDYPDEAAYAGRSRIMNRQYRSNSPSQVYLDVVPNSADVLQGFAEFWRMGRGIIPNDRTQERRNQIVHGHGCDPKCRIHERNNLPFNSNIHSWLYIDIPEQFQILEMPEFITTPYPNMACRPNVSLASRYACYGRRRAADDWIETKFWEDRIEGWSLGSEQVAAKMRKMRDNTNLLYAVSVGGSNIEDAAPRREAIRVDSLYESMSRDIAPPPYHALLDSTNGMPRNPDHRVTKVDGRLLSTHKMLSVLLNPQKRCQVILDVIAYDDEWRTRTSILGDGYGTMSSYSSHIGGVPLPKRRVGSIILESFYPAESGGQGARSEEGTVEGHERRDEKEPRIQNRNAEDNETNIINSILRPGHRPEDSSRTSRPRFYTSNGSQFATPRVCIYPSTILSINQVEAAPRIEWRW
uniref:Hypothetical chloroplast RF19 n=1 Tax=Selaginella moellendorffii TaxID=88036 RepID=C7B2J9_SELML|nr:hypothetical protein SemoP_p068 [Selaginella moellendorffii]ACT89037.1 hypothetical protein [Selaginella moellendorffii]ADH10446.1 hypothetical chloroplast RF19 [Selaginella moellendorffii]